MYTLVATKLAWRLCLPHIREKKSINPLTIGVMHTTDVYCDSLQTLETSLLTFSSGFHSDLTIAFLFAGKLRRFGGLICSPKECSTTKASLTTIVDLMRLMGRDFFTNGTIHYCCWNSPLTQIWKTFASIKLFLASIVTSPVVNNIALIISILCKSKCVVS